MNTSIKYENMKGTASKSSVTITELAENLFIMQLVKICFLRLCFVWLKPVVFNHYICPIFALPLSYTTHCLMECIYFGVCQQYIDGCALFCFYEYVKRKQYDWHFPQTLSFYTLSLGIISLPERSMVLYTKILQIY